MALKNALLAVAAIAPTVLAQGAAYAQCKLWPYLWSSSF